MVFRADLDCVPSEMRSRVYSALPSFIARSHGMRSRSEKPLLSRPLQPSLFLPRFSSHTPCVAFSHSVIAPPHPRRFSSVYSLQDFIFPPVFPTQLRCISAEASQSISERNLRQRKSFRRYPLLHSIDRTNFSCAKSWFYSSWIHLREFRRNLVRRESALHFNEIFMKSEKDKNSIRWWSDSSRSAAVINVFHEQRRIR